jgi:hypothetical protein
MTIRINHCPFQPPGGSIGPRYVLQLLFIAKSKIVNISTTTEARGKNP